MKSITTDAIICLRDDYDIEYFISEIHYILWDNEEFEYIFKPNYAVIDLLDSSVFQGIPGLDLDERKQVYTRKNIVPTFISERSPSKNREELWKLLEDCNMDYLNPIEWLIRTDTKYIGDRLYVKKYNDFNTTNELILFHEEANTLKRARDVHKRLLDFICHGCSLDFDGFIITDANRKSCYELLLRLYRKEAKYIANQQALGIQQAKQAKKYLGRKSISIDDTKLNDIIDKYRRKKISATEAAALLNISNATFFRRLKQHEQKHELPEISHNTKD